MPAGEVVVIRVLLRLPDGVGQLLLVVLVDELAGLLAFVRHQFGVAPLPRQRPDLDGLALGGRHQPLLLQEEVHPRDLVVECLQHV